MIPGIHCSPPKGLLGSFLCFQPLNLKYVVWELSTQDGVDRVFLLETDPAAAKLKDAATLRGAAQLTAL